MTFFMFSGICKDCFTRHRENCLSSPLKVDFEEDLGKKNNYVLIHVYNKAYLYRFAVIYSIIVKNCLCWAASQVEMSRKLKS